MKYNKDIYSLSKILNSLTNYGERNDSIKQTEEKLLAIITEKLRHVALCPNNNELNGSITIRFEDYFFSNSEPGYMEIKELLKSNNFDSFAREYCIYLREMTDYGMERDNYIILTWDYKTYYENLNPQKVKVKKLKRNNN